jgi:hypothetical protein
MCVSELSSRYPVVRNVKIQDLTPKTSDLTPKNFAINTPVDNFDAVTASHGGRDSPPSVLLVDSLMT